MFHNALLPESKVAVLRAADNKEVRDLAGNDIRYSVIDGLQRLNCMLIAILLLLHGEDLLDSGLITAEAWDYFQEPVEKLHLKRGQ